MKKSTNDSQALEMTLYSSKGSIAETETSSSEITVPTWSVQYFLANFSGGLVFDSVLTMLAATIGSGVLMISNAMSASGLIWSVAQMLFCGYLSYFSLMTLIKSADSMNVHSYQDLALNTYGHACRLLTNATIFFLNFGTIVLYLKLITGMFAASMNILCGSWIPAWVVDPHGTLLTFLIATFFVFPLAVGKEYKALRYFCLVKFSFVLFFFVVVILEAFDYGTSISNLQTMDYFTFMGFTTTFPTGVFAYSSHANVLEVYQELKNRSLQKMTRVVNWSVFFVFVGYAVIGILGYTTFAGNLDILRSTTKANGLLIVAYGYSLDGTPRASPTFAVIGMLAMSLAVIISQPFNIRPAKACFMNFFKPFENASKDNNQETDKERYLYTALILYAAVVVELGFTSSQHILDLIGSSVFPLCCFILPSVFYLKVYQNSITQEDKRNHLMMIGFNLIFMIWMTAKNIVSGGGSH